MPLHHPVILSHNQFAILDIPSQIPLTIFFPMSKTFPINCPKPSTIVFTILGASVITANLKKQIANSDGKEIKLDLNNSEEIKERKNAAIELIKPIFTKYDAVNQEKAMMKEEVFAETEDAMAKQQFM